MKLLVLLLAVLVGGIISAAFLIDYLTLPKTSIPQERVTLDVIGYNSYVERDTVDFYVTAGEVYNNFSGNVKSVTVNVAYYNEKDYTIGYANAPTELDIVKPGLKIPFRTYTKADSLGEIPARAELSCSGLVTHEQPFGEVDIALAYNGTDEYGYYIISGELENVGPSEVSGVKVLCTYYDSEGDVMVVSHAYPSCPNLKVGSKSTFELSSEPHMIEPASYELSIRIGSYEQIFDMRYPFFFALVVVFVAFILYMKKYRGW